ncbi:MAG: FkbM family methyltransferase [Balneolales bacterium]
MEPLFRRKGFEHVLDLPGNKTKFSGPLLDWIPWQVFLYGCYLKEQVVGDYMLSQIREGNTIFDIGANLGYYSVQFAEKTGNKGSVYSFEPLDYQLQYLKQNISLNRLDHITVEKQIVSDRAGEQTIYFSSSKNSGQSSIHTPTKTFESIPAITLDDYCRENNIARIDLIKIDVEGHEYKVVTGMESLLSSKSVGSLFIEINDANLKQSGSSGKELVNFLNNKGYKAYKITETGITAYQGNQDESLIYFTGA